jgi:hypothetical protein
MASYVYRGREFDEHGRAVRGEDLYDSTRDRHYDREADPFLRVLHTDDSTPPP